MGYEFGAYSETSPYSALGRVRDKMSRGFATRYTTTAHGARRMLHDGLKGRDFPVISGLAYALRYGRDIPASPDARVKPGRP